MQTTFTMKPLTIVEQEILDAIKSFQSEHGFSPTYRDLMLATDRASPSSIQSAVKKLKGKGRLTYLPNRPRTLTILENP